MFFSRGCAARHNAGSFKRPRHYRRQTVGVKERGFSGVGEIAKGLREYEDAQIAAGKMAPRKSMRDWHSAEIKACATKKKFRRKKS